MTDHNPREAMIGIVFPALFLVNESWSPAMVIPALESAHQLRYSVFVVSIYPQILLIQELDLKLSSCCDLIVNLLERNKY